MAILSSRGVTVGVYGGLRELENWLAPEWLSLKGLALVLVLLKQLSFVSFRLPNNTMFHGY